MPRTFIEDAILAERKRRDLVPPRNCICYSRLERDESGCLRPVYCYAPECARALFDCPEGDVLPGVRCGAVGSVRMR